MSGLWGPSMFFGALVLIFSGYPVAFALGGTALLFALLGSATGRFDPILLYALPERTFGTMSNFTLLAVPFFIFMGIVLEKSRLAEQLFHALDVCQRRPFAGPAWLGMRRQDCRDALTRLEGQVYGEHVRLCLGQAA